MYALEQADGLTIRKPSRALPQHEQVPVQAHGL
jgi:hypothetical protein